MVFITRKETFSASHKLNNENLSKEDNKRIYGKCNNDFGHGHNYILEVVIAGEIDETTGYLIDILQLKKIIKENIIDKVDHHHLNFDVEFMKNKIPTTENFAVAIWNELVNKIPNGKLYSVKLYETEKNYVEYKG
jgi:6-pyruvoyltetrahydropterin/6-carboxytetrahydropterin synthase